MKSLALKLFDDRNSLISTRIVLKAEKPCVYRIDFDKISLLNGLYRASIFEINRIVACLVEMEDDDTEQRNSMGDTPLAWAAGNGHEGVVEILLGRDDIDPNKPGRDGQTPLLRAVWNGYEGVVKMLLGRDDINPNTPEEHSQTPLLWAAWKGHEGIVKALLGRGGVDPNQLGTAQHLSYGLSGRSTRELWKCYSDETTSTPTYQTGAAKHLSYGLFGRSMRKL